MRKKGSIHLGWLFKLDAQGKKRRLKKSKSATEGSSSWKLKLKKLWKRKRQTY